MPKSEYAEKLLLKIKASEESLKMRRAAMLVNVAYFKGAQHHDYNSGLGLFQYVPPMPAWRVKLIVNYIRTVAMVMSAKLTQNRPAMTAKPATLEEDDIEIARLSQRLMDHEWEDSNGQDKLYRAVLWSVICGTGFWGIYWDSERGQTLEEADPKAKTKKAIKTGGCVIDVIRPFDIGMDPMADDIASAEWAYRKRMVSVAWVKANFDKKVEAHVATGNEDTMDHDMFESSILQNVENYEEFASNYITLYEWYDTVKGEVVWMTSDGELVYKDKWDGPVPFIAFRAIPNMGDIEYRKVGSGLAWGDTPLSDAIPLQRELNKLEAQLIEYKNAAIFPKILASTAARIKRYQLQSEPASIIEWSGLGPVPQAFHVGNIPGWAFQLSERIIQRILDLMGIHEVSQGKAPGSLQSGRAVAILAEMDATRFGPWTRNIGQAIKEAGQRILILYKDYARGPILLRVTGASGALEVDTFNTSTISSTDVIVDEGSTFALNKNLRNDQIMMMWDKGMIKDQRKALRMMEFGQIEEAIGNIDRDRMRARRNIYKMRHGEKPRLEEFDDFYIHIEEYDSYMKSSTFEEMPTERQDLFRQVRAEYQAKIQQAQMQEQMAAQQRGVASAGATQVEGVMPAPMEQGAPVMGTQQGMNPGGDIFPGATAMTLSGGQ